MSKSLCDHLTGNEKCGSLMIIDDISQSDMSLIAYEIFRLIKNYDDPYDAYILVLSKYGIMCPHPQIKRLYNGFKKSMSPLANFKWYNCSMCKCAAINEESYVIENYEVNGKKV